MAVPDHQVWPLLDNIRAEKLTALARSRYNEELTPAEVKVIRDTASSADPIADPRHMSSLNPAFIRWLASDGEAAALMDPRGMRIACANILGDLNLNACRIQLPLNFVQCSFSGSIYLVASESRGITIIDSKLNGITADRLATNGSFIARGLKASNEFRLHGARINGHLECSGSEFDVTGFAINFDSAEIMGNAFFKRYPGDGDKRPFRSNGPLCGTGATIRGDFDCTGAILQIKEENPIECSICFDRATVGGSVHLGESFRANRKITFADASVGSVFQCRGGRLADNGYAVSLNRAKVGGSAFFDSGFHASGLINLSNAEIGCDLNFNRASLGPVVCEGVRVQGDLIWTNVSDSEKANGRFLNISGGSVRTVFDDKQSWPAKGNLVLVGFEYSDLAYRERAKDANLSELLLAARLDLVAAERIHWLNLQSEENRSDPHAWTWLAKLFKEKDDVTGYRHILCEYRILKASKLTNIWKRRIEIALADLERNPWSILYTFVTLLVFGTLVFWWQASAGHIPPTSSDAYVAWEKGKQFPIAYPRFNPLIYTLDNELPLFKFGMDDKWAPDPNLVTQNKSAVYWSIAGLRWTLIFAGWVQGILLTVGINRRFRD